MIFVYSEASIPSAIQKVFDFKNISNCRLLKQIESNDFISQFNGKCLIDILTSYNLETDPSSSLCSISMMLTEIGINSGDEKISLSFLQEIRSILFLTIRSEKNLKSCWCLTTKQHVSLIVHSLLPLLKCYNTSPFYKIFFTCLSSTNEVTPAILISNEENLKFSNVKESPFDDLSISMKREYDNVPTIREDFISKITASIFHFCLHSEEEISIEILRNISETSLSSLHIVEVLELTLISFLNNTKKEFPKKFAIESFKLYDDVYSTFFTSLLEVSDIVDD